MSDHARIAPSNSSRVLLCAASVAREEVLPDSDNAAANEGSNVHWIAEQAFKDEQWPPVMMAFGMPQVQATAPYPEVEISQENIENAKLYYEYVQRRAEEMKPAVVRIEETVNPQLYTSRDDSWGHCDAMIVSDPMLEIIDYKNGGVLVDEDESQLKLYALGAMAEYADPLSGLPPFPRVRLTVFQPKRPGENCIERSVNFTPQELITWATDVWAPAAAASDDPNARATVTEGGCRYCKARKAGTCPEFTAHSQGAAAMLFQPVEGQAIEVVDPLQSQFSAEAMTNEQIAYFLTVWPVMVARAKDIKEAGLERKKQRQDIPGFKAVHGRGSRTWAHDDETMAKKCKNLKLTLKQVFKSDLRSPAQMLALNIPTKKKESIQKLIVKKQGALELVPVTDKRVDAIPQVEFNPVETVSPPATVAEATPAANLDFLSL